MTKKTVLLLTAGALGVFLGFPNPVGHLPLLALLHPAALHLAGLEAGGARRAFKRGLLCSTAGAALALYWLAVPAANVAGLPLPLAALCPLGVALYIGAFGGAFCALSFALRAVPLFRRCLILGCMWHLLEFARGFVFSGFPWLTLASAFAPWPAMLQGASVIGGYALGGVLALAACLLSGGPRRPAAALLGAALLGGLFAGGERRIALYDEEAAAAARTPLKAAFIEGNIDQNQKWNTAMQRSILNLHIKLSQTALAEDRPDLLIWSETAMPFHYQNHPVFPPAIREFAAGAKVWLLFGAPGHDKKPGGGYAFYNRAYLVDPQGRDAGYYEKEHLVPFGEYLPPWLDFEFARGFLQGLGDFTPGERVEPLRMGGLALGMLICYETIFPELAQKRVAAGADMLVNISNDQWFGLTSAPMQHLQQAALRAVEQRRWLLRGAGSGISAVYDPVGRLTARGAQMREEAVYGLAFAEKGFTIFHMLFPYVPFAAIAVAGFLLLTRRRGARTDDIPGGCACKR